MLFGNRLPQTARSKLRASPTVRPLFMQIWIDADACPVVVKEIVFRAAERLQIETILVANRMLRTPPSRFIRAIQVPSGFDGADANIAEALSMRNFLEELRGSGVQTGGPAAFSQADRQAFGAALDRFLAKAVKKPQD